MTSRGLIIVLLGAMAGLTTYFLILFGKQLYMWLQAKREDIRFGIRLMSLIAIDDNSLPRIMTEMKRVLKWVKK